MRVDRCLTVHAPGVVAELDLEQAIAEPRDDRAYLTPNQTHFW
jgi:hypothetical protein